LDELGGDLNKTESRLLGNHFVRKFESHYNVNDELEFSVPPSLSSKILESSANMEAARRVFNHLCSKLKDKSLCDSFLKKNWESFFPLLYKILRNNHTKRRELNTTIEGMTKAQKKTFFKTSPLSHDVLKPFTLIPEHSVAAKYVFIDEYALWELSRPLWKNKRLYNQCDSWNFYFNVSKVETANKKFDWTFATDGVGVSIQCKVRVRKKPEYQFPSIEQLQNAERILGVDCGRIDLYVAADGFQENSHISGVSNKTYYSLARFTNSTKKRIFWKNQREDIQTIETEMPSSRVGTLELYTVHVEHIIKNLNTLTSFYCSKRHRRLRFDAYIGRDEAKEKIADKFVQDSEVSPEKLLVAWGNAKFGQQSKGNASSPRATWLQANLRRRGVIVFEVPEDYTSQTCPKLNCKSRLPKNTRKWQVKSCPSCFTIWNRDVAAGCCIQEIGIHMIINNGEIPDIYKRKTQ
jgi:hypothetical protein